MDNIIDQRQKKSISICDSTIAPYTVDKPRKQPMK